MRKGVAKDFIKSENGVWERKQAFSPGWVCDLPSFVYRSCISNAYVIPELFLRHINNWTCEIVAIYSVHIKKKKLDIFACV